MVGDFFFLPIFVVYYYCFPSIVNFDGGANFYYVGGDPFMIGVPPPTPAVPISGFQDNEGLNFARKDFYQDLLQTALSKSNTEIVKYLLKNAVDIEFAGLSTTTLQLALSTGNVQQVKFLLEQDPTTIDSTFEIDPLFKRGSLSNRCKPIEFAAFNGNTDIIDYLVEKGASLSDIPFIGSISNVDSMVAKCARHFGCAGFFEHLIRRPTLTDVFLFLSAGTTWDRGVSCPLDYAVKYGKLDLFESLMDRAGRRWKRCVFEAANKLSFLKHLLEVRHCTIFFFLYLEQDGKAVMGAACQVAALTDLKVMNDVIRDVQMQP